MIVNKQQFFVFAFVNHNINGFNIKLISVRFKANDEHLISNVNIDEQTRKKNTSIIQY